MSPENPDNKKRFTLNLPTSALEELEGVRHERGHGALAEVVREAVEVYLALHDGRRKGLELFFKNQGDGSSGPIWLLPGPAPGSQERD